MKKTKIQAVLASGLLWSAVLGLAPSARAQQIGELSDGNASILALCKCTESAEAAKSANCKPLLASLNPEQQRAPSSPGGMGVHQLMGSAPGMGMGGMMAPGAAMMGAPQQGGMMGP